jgi:signal transduction histidine kinase
MDSTKMSQVLINVLTNAIKYSPQNKKIIVKAERIGDEVKISIHDRGIGVATEHLDKIFTQFYRAPTDENKTAGLGLGLYLCKEFVEAHHGKIWAESEIGNGTVIHIVLPVKLIKEQ